MLTTQEKIDAALKLPEFVVAATMIEIAERPWLTKARTVANVHGSLKVTGRKGGHTKKSVEVAYDGVWAWRHRAAVEEVIEVVTSLPFGSIIALDTRGGRARWRLLPGLATLVNRFANAELASVEQLRGLPPVEYQTDDGGAIWSNSYGYTAETDGVSVCRVEGRLIVWAGRVFAGRRKGPCQDVFPGSDWLRDVIARGLTYRAQPSGPGELPELRSVPAKIQVMLDANADLPCQVDLTTPAQLDVSSVA